MHILERARKPKNLHRKRGPSGWQKRAANSGANFSPFCNCQTSSHVNMLFVLSLKICQLIHFEGSCLKRLRFPIVIARRRKKNKMLWQNKQKLRLYGRNRFFLSRLPAQLWGGVYFGHFSPSRASQPDRAGSWGFSLSAGGRDLFITQWQEGCSGK